MISAWIRSNRVSSANFAAPSNASRWGASTWLSNWTEIIWRLRDLDLSQLLEASALSACGPVHALSAAGRQLDAFREVTMIRLIAIAGFAVSIAVSAQAMTVAPTIAQPDSMVTEVAAACGVGRTRINGVCVARTTVRHTRRAVRRCVRGTTC